MTQTRRTIGPIAVFAVAAACALSSGAHAQTAQARSFLWKVQSPTGSAPVYLAGSVHMLSADVYPLNPAFDRAFESAATLVEEINLGEALTAAPAMLQKGLFNDGRTLDRVVSKSTFDLLTDRLKDTGLPAEMVSLMKPWMVAMILMATDTQKAGLSPALGLDQHFFEKAAAAGKPVKGLESPESQVDRLDGLSPAVQEQMLRSTLTDLEQERQNLKQLIDAWRQGDAPSLERILLADFKDSPAAYQSLIVERNRDWIGQIDACLLQRAPCFVVVGAAHLVGPDGLVTLLQRKGYRVDQQ